MKKFLAVVHDGSLRLAMVTGSDAARLVRMAHRICAEHPSADPFRVTVSLELRDAWTVTATAGSDREGSPALDDASSILPGLAPLGSGRGGAVVLPPARYGDLRTGMEEAGWCFVACSAALTATAGAPDNLQLMFLPPMLSGEPGPSWTPLRGFLAGTTPVV